ncbi:MAG: phosphatidylglycerophosphatase A [Gammaproteobacteria bacterium]
MSIHVPAKRVFRDPVLFAAFGFGSGLAPRAPGTFGTVAALALFPLLPSDPLAYAIAVFVALVVGIPLCGAASSRLGVHDHGGIVWDEFVGLWIALFMLPDGWVWWVFGFALFRVFDIVKPWPIGWLDRRVQGGWGIMVDDVIAGLFAWVVLQATALLF